MLVASSVSVVGVKVPVQVMLSLLVIVASAPLATVMSAELEKESTASEKASVKVAVSPIFSAVSLRVKVFTVGAMVSTIKTVLIPAIPLNTAGPGLPAMSV